ncbi:MAG TPA: putative Na+/H+ antiporter [Vicinamibacteria bacterium]|nr:putative Na+/H+ antiporter [Vicinamibacteria bacterium]
MTPPPAAGFPPPLESYAAGGDLVAILRSRVAAEPLNAVATGIFFLAILHTFAVYRFRVAAHHVQERHARRERAAGRPETPSVRAELLHFLGEVEVVFGLWAVALMGAIALSHGWPVARDYLGHTVNYTEPLFVVVIMALASTQPVIALAEDALRRVAALLGGRPWALWLSVLTLGPLLGSLVTEPAAMTISALLLSRQFYVLRPSRRLAYATLGALFVNVSVGGTLTHFAAPPVLMVARPWQWTTPFMLTHFGWRAVLAILATNLVYFVFFRRELLSLRPPDVADGLQPPTASAPRWVVAVHVAFMAWTVVNAHYPALFVGGFLFFLGFAKATAPHQSALDLKSPLLVGFFLAGLVIHGGLQGWWIAPVLASLSQVPLFAGALVLTAFNDNALITYLATLVPDFSEGMKLAVVAGAVTGGGLTVIANAPNPAGQAILGPHFDDGVAPIGLLLGAALPTALAAAVFLLV